MYFFYMTQIKINSLKEKKINKKNYLSYNYNIL